MVLAQANNKVSKPKSILVIDDDPLILKLLQETLEQEGYEVILAANGVYLLFSQGLLTMVEWRVENMNQS